MAKKAMQKTAKAPAKAESKSDPVAKLAAKSGAKLAPSKPAPFTKRWQDSAKITFLGDNGKVNPRSSNVKDTKVNSPFARYAAIMRSKTVGEALKNGAWSGTIYRAWKEGRLTVDGAKYVAPVAKAEPKAPAKAPAKAAPAKAPAKAASK
jgi:hypothetical protein